MKYQVKRTCYFSNRLFEKGEIVTLEGSVPEHFSPLPQEEVIPQEVKPKRQVRKNTKEQDQ